VDIRSWLLRPFKLVRVWVEVGICAYHAVGTTNRLLLGARLNLRACGLYLATKKKEAYQSRHTCPFDRKHKKKSLRDSDPEDNTPKHRSGRKFYNKIPTRTIQIVTILSHLCGWPNQDFTFGIRGLLLRSFGLAKGGFDASQTNIEAGTRLSLLNAFGHSCGTATSQRPNWRTESV
jgi:hypothetical protein